MTPIKAQNVLYIKLGTNGGWEAESIRDGTLRIGYRQLTHELCTQARWDDMMGEALKLKLGKDPGAITRHVNQVRQFYEAPPSTLWITFYSDRLWWCFANSAVILSPDGTKLRRTKDGWHDSDVQGRPLLKGRLGGKLLAVQGFQGTICSVSESSHLLHRINGTVPRHVEAVQIALEGLQKSVVLIIQKLHPKDLEILTDLIFRQAGWQRTGVLGGVERDIDLDLISPITRERIAVQLKSRASAREYARYRRKYEDSRGFSRFYFVTHSPSADLVKAAAVAEDPTFVYWGPQELAALAVRTGLVGWPLDKAS